MRWTILLFWNTLHNQNFDQHYSCSCIRKKNIRSAALWADHQRNAGGCTTLQDFVFSFPTPASPTLLEWPFQQQRGFCLTTSAPVSNVSALACTNSVWPPLRPVSVVQKNKQWPCCPRMSNPSTSPWTARRDSSGWWDNWMAVQHLPWDLVRPRSGLKELAQTMKKAILTWRMIENWFWYVVFQILQIGLQGE